MRECIRFANIQKIMFVQDLNDAIARELD